MKFKFINNLNFIKIIFSLILYFFICNIGYSQIVVKEIDTKEQKTIWSSHKELTYGKQYVRILSCLSVNNKNHSGFELCFEYGNKKIDNNELRYPIYTIKIGDLETTKQFFNLLLSVNKNNKSFEVKIRGINYTLQPSSGLIEISTIKNITTLFSSGEIVEIINLLENLR